MRISKQHSSLRKSVKVRSLDVRIPTETAYPVVEIVNGNKDDVWARLLGDFCV